MKRFMVMCTCLSLVMLVVGGIPQASGEIRGYEVVKGSGPITAGIGKSAKIVYCSKGRVVLGGGVHRTWAQNCPGVSPSPVCPLNHDTIVLNSYPYKNQQSGQSGWSAQIKGAGGTLRPWRATVYAICAIP